MFKKEKKSTKQQPKEQEVQMTKLVVKDPINVIAGRYANLVNVSNTSEEFVFDFALAFNDDATLVSRVCISPRHAKRLAETLLGNIKLYEDQNGKIETL